MIKSKVLRFVLLSFLMLGLLRASNAQIEYLENNLIQQFVNRGSTKKIKHFNGLLDGYHPVLLTVIWDAFQSKGVLNYLESKEEYALSGKYEDGTFYLSEDNPNGDITGYITGNIEGKYFKGQWTNYDNTIGAPIVARERKSDYYEKHKAKNSWLKTYATAKTKFPVHILIQQTAFSNIIGSIWIEKEHKTFLLEGTVDEKGNLVSSILLDNGSKWGELVGKLKENGDSKILIKTGQELTNLRCQLTSKSNIKQLSHAEFSANYVLSIPKTPHNNFNKWLEDYLRDLVSEFRKSRKNEGASTPANRSKDRFSGTPYIEFWNDKIVTGWINIECSENTFIQTIPFNYHLDLNRNLEFEDLFTIKDFSILKNQFLTEAIENLKKENPNQALQNWMDKESFSKINLRKEGIHFSTDFNAIFGKLGFTIPYEKLTSHLNKEVLEAIK